MDGIIVLDKPAGISSHDAVQRARRLTGIKRIGHLGTLDPIGTGVLPLVVGKATRLAQFFLKHDRTYEAEFRVGFATDTYDSGGEPTSEAVAAEVSETEMEASLEEFRGEIVQTPPPVSAKKIGGVPAYKLARKKQPVVLEPVNVTVHELALLSVEGPLVRVRVRCSAGTYVRSIAHDLGRKLGVGAHVQALRRASMGEFDISDAYTLDTLESLRGEGRLEEALVPAARVLLEIPARRVDEVTAAHILQGRDFRVSAFGAGQGAKRIKAIDPHGRLVAIAEAKLPLVYHPIVVF